MLFYFFLLVGSLFSGSMVYFVVLLLAGIVGPIVALVVSMRRIAKKEEIEKALQLEKEKAAKALQLEKEKAAKALTELRNSPTAVMTEEEDGTQSWWQKSLKHRVDGPAVIKPDGTQQWGRHGELHREDGPAVIKADGSEFWFKHGKLDRVDGPAATLADGTKQWYADDALHRVDGPAIEFADGTVQYWWLNWECSKQEHALKMVQVKEHAKANAEKAVKFPVDNN